MKKRKIMKYITKIIQYIFLIQAKIKILKLTYYQTKKSTTTIKIKIKIIT